MTAPPDAHRPTWVEVDLSAIRDNCRALQALLGETTVQCAVVKANAYGHGDVEVSRAALDAGAGRLAVALVEEGVRLRDAGITAPILVLVEPPVDACSEVVARRLVASISTRACAEALAEAAAVAGAEVAVEVCVDTGMHREGASVSDAADLALYVARLPGLVLSGVWSHLAVADERDHPVTVQQIERFDGVLKALARQGVNVAHRHLANSAGTIANREAHYDMVRTGIAIYGLYPADWMRDAVALRPALSLHSRVGAARRVPAGEGVSYGLMWSAPRDATVVTVPVGYADGYMRLLSGRSAVVIRGRRRPVVGRVTMDQILVDCGDDDVDVGEDVVLIGRQGDTEVTADELAGHVGTINYEVVSSIGARVPRVYVG